MRVRTIFIYFVSRIRVRAIFILYEAVIQHIIVTNKMNHEFYFSSTVPLPWARTWCAGLCAMASPVLHWHHVISLVQTAGQWLKLDARHADHMSYVPSRQDKVRSSIQTTLPTVPEHESVCLFQRFLRAVCSLLLKSYWMLQYYVLGISRGWLPFGCRFWSMFSEPNFLFKLSKVKNLRELHLKSTTKKQMHVC
jgi:hypothetical protein